jgi:hypothetical protein
VRFPREGAIPRERPVTAPVCTFSKVVSIVELYCKCTRTLTFENFRQDGASRTNRVLSFAPSPQRHDTKPPKKGAVLASCEVPGAAGQASPRRYLPSAPPTRGNVAVYAVEWAPPTTAKALFGRMKSAQAQEHMDSLDFSALSGPVIRQVEPHRYHRLQSAEGSSGSSSNAKADVVFVSLDPGSFRDHALAGAVSAHQPTSRQIPRPSTSWLRPSPKVSRTRPKTAAAAAGRSSTTSLTNHDFLHQARAILQLQREKERLEEGRDAGVTARDKDKHMQRTPDKTHAVGHSKPSPPATRAPARVLIHMPLPLHARQSGVP